jgi:predicted metal-dependent phosphoesterase TrpH
MALKIDFHVHSNASPDGLATLDALAAAARHRGLDAIAICDHNRITLTGPELRSGIWLLPGCEISARGCHILALFCTSPCNLSSLTAEGLPEPETVIREIRRQGGLAVIAHPFDHKWDPKALALQPDGTETFNARAHMRNRTANLQAAAYAADFRLIPFGGSDAHSTTEVGNAYTVVDTDKIDGLRAALTAGHCYSVLGKNTRRLHKGRSQFTKAWRSRSVRRILRGGAYLTYCILRDILHI